MKKRAYYEAECSRILLETWLRCMDHIPGTPAVFFQVTQQFGSSKITEVKDKDMEKLYIVYCWLAIYLRRKMLKYKYAKDI